MENYYYYQQEIYKNTNTIIEKIEEQNEKIETLNKTISNGFMLIAVILCITMLHHLFDSWWKGEK